MTEPADEARRWVSGPLHANDPEVWSLDFVSSDGTLGVIIELGVRPRDATSWFWFFVTGPGRKLIALVDDEAPVPTPPGLELRAPGLWTELCVQVAFDHFTFDLEAFGVELDEPAALLGSAYGDRVALGGELEWDTDAPVVAQTSGYEIACTVHGELLIDDQTIELSGTGWRSHWWGPDRLNAGFRGRDGDGAPTRTFNGGTAPTVEAGASSEAMKPTELTEPIELIVTPAGITHQMIAEPGSYGWWRGELS